MTCLPALIVNQVVVGSFLFGPFKTDSKAESPLASTQEGTPGVATPSATHQQPSVPRRDAQGTSGGLCYTLYCCVTG